MDHNCSCHDAPISRDDSLKLAYDLLVEGQHEALDGRVAEAQTLNVLAQTAIALAERTIPPSLSGPVH